MLPVHDVGLTVRGVIPKTGSSLHYLAEIGNGRTWGGSHEGEEAARDRNNAKATNVGVSYRPERVRGFEIGTSYYRDAIPRPDLPTVPHRIAAAYVVYRTPSAEVMAEWLTLDHHTPEGVRYDNHAGYAQASKAWGKVRPYDPYHCLAIDPATPFIGPAGSYTAHITGLRLDPAEWVGLKTQDQRADKAGQRRRGFAAHATGLRVLAVSVVIRRTVFCVALIGLITIAATQGAPGVAQVQPSNTGDALAIIVHRSNPVDALTRNELRRIFMLETQTWPNGRKSPWSFAKRGNPSAPRRSGLVCGMSESEYDRHVLFQTFRGNVGLGPRAILSASAMLRFVFNAPGAIGYGNGRTKLTARRKSCVSTACGRTRLGIRCTGGRGHPSPRGDDVALAATRTAPRAQPAGRGQRDRARTGLDCGARSSTVR